MLFSTFHFWFFFVATSAGFFAVSKRVQPWFLLAVSYLFYMCWEPAYGILLAFCTITSFVSAIQIASTDIGFRRILYLTLGLTANLGMLVFFKYAGFLMRTLEEAFRFVDIPIQTSPIDVALPVGISFFTFQAASYVVDVYRRKTEAERSLGLYALFIAFFPPLVAGPIERAESLLTQFRTEKHFDPERAVSGLKLALWGLFKKVCIADLLATVVATTYRAPEQHSGPILLLATIFFSFQIYCDFSGYSDIAIGIAKILGFDLTVNFRQPYLSTSVGEFWRRWHISLSTWFRDYLYLPLGGNRVRLLTWVRNTLIVFMVSGLWHGASWNFVIWGGLHGLYLIFGRLTQPLRSTIAEQLGLTRRPSLLKVLQTSTVFFLVVVAWVFFRAGTLDQALYILSHMTNLSGFRLYDLWSLGLPRFEMVMCFVMLGILAVVDTCMAQRPAFTVNLWGIRPVRWACYNALIFGIVFFGVLGDVQFIYFQF